MLFFIWAKIVKNRFDKHLLAELDFHVDEFFSSGAEKDDELPFSREEKEQRRGSKS